MKRSFFAISLLCALLLDACNDKNGDYSDQYNPEVCNDLAVRIDHRDSLSQADYTAMIGQTEAIIKYLISEHKRIEAEPQDEHASDWRVLYSDPDYMERFGYFFTLGSALYRADTKHLFDSRNQRLYKTLDDYNTELASVSIHSN
ncbi:MAG: hypothetical protein HDS99_05535 [Bacteroidales bacterium]|nr:hypothetical protein [Bacteroidales bacterium]